jgi:hypothetical protein
VVLKSSIIIKYFLPSHSLLLLFVPNKQIPLGGVSHPCSRVAPASAECCACPKPKAWPMVPTMPIIPLRLHRPTAAPLTRAACLSHSSAPATSSQVRKVRTLFLISIVQNGRIWPPGIWVTVTCFLKLPRNAASSSGLLSRVSR